MSEENEVLMFHDEKAVARITLWTNIIAYTILVFSLTGFINQAYSIITNWSQVVSSLPAGLLERISIFATQVFMDPLVGVFYFLVLRGISQLLNIGLDLLYKNEA
jgi:uncharacterized membrane protein YdfJ with MMPL/SSD domain